MSKLTTEIQKTGFVLENEVAQNLKTDGWTVISNKYYVDDQEENVREIDLIAYRATKIQRFQVYTVLVIGCKKSDSNLWAMLARDINLTDPNSDWCPLHAWSNDKALQFQLSQDGLSKRYHDEINSLGTTAALKIPEVEVFAFQEMDKHSGKPQNDKPIFSTITSLMKAQAYEISSLPLRKKNPVLYQFNLISVIDTDLVRIKFNKNDISCSETEDEHYISRYIINKRETFSRIRFVRASAFKKILGDYKKLHVQNCKWFNTCSDQFYDNVLNDWSKIDVFINDFRQRVAWFLYFRIESKLKENFNKDEISLSLDSKTGEAIISLNASKAAIDFLNSDPSLRPRISGALKEFYRFEGKFKFDDNYIPW